MTLTVAIATRGRPGILRGTLQTMLANVARKDTSILVAVDDDDDVTIRELIAMPQDSRMVYSIKPRELTRGMKYDRALTEAPADVYLVGVDHTTVTTPGFDQKIIDAADLFEDGIGCVCTPMANASFPYLQAPTAKLCELMGYIQPPHFPFWFIDHWLDDIARMIGRYSMAEITADSSARPGNTIGLKHLAFWTMYFDELAGERREQANRIIDAMDESPAHKARLRANFPLVEYRSLWVNDHVRSNAKAMEQGRGTSGPADMNYLRALQKASGHLLELTDGRLAA